MLAKKTNQKGFTIVELMIAALVFSIILIIIMAAVLQITRNYYKGVSTTRTQEVARNIMQTVSEAIQFSGGSINTNLASNNGSIGFCVDHYRFSYVDTDSSHPGSHPGYIFDGSASTHGLVEDDVSPAGCAGTLSAQDLTSGLPLAPTSKEILLPRMSVRSINVSQISSTNLYQITISIEMGDNTLLSGGRCVGGNGTQFCATTSLTNVVEKRVQ